jgi:hypothetical protein
MRHIARALSLTAALLVVGCGNDDQNFNYGWYNPGGGGTPGVVAPVAVADSFSVPSGGTLTGSVTANDTLNGATVTAFQNPSASGGAVAVTAAGQLTYTPPTGQTNISDTFTYTLSNSAGSATATVTVAVGARGFFVKNDVASTGSGSQASPFKTLLEATTAASGINGAQIVVFRGDGTSTGQNVPVALSANQGIVAQDPTNQPTISGPINLASNTTLSNLRLVGTTGGDAVIGTGIAGATLSNLTIANTTVNGVNMTNPTGTLTMTGMSFTNIGRAAFPLSINAGVLTIAASNWTATNTVGNVSETFVAGGAIVNAAFWQVVLNQIGASNFGTGFEWDAGGTSNVTLRITSLRFDTGGNGLFFSSRDTSNTAVLVNAANITNGVDRAIILNALNSSSLKTRVTDCLLVGNFQGFRATANLSAQFCARLTGNTSDRYDFSNASALPMLVENLPGLSSNPDNIGATNTTGTVQNAAVDSCGIPF